MSIAQRLINLSDGLTAEGVLGPTKGGVPAGGIPDPGPTGNVLVSNGTVWTSTSGAAGPTGPAGAAGTAGPTGPAGTNGTIGVNGATGPTGPSGLGFTIAKTYSSVAQLTADTAPTGIVAGQFALVDTGDVNNAENSRLYIWNGTSYTYTSDLSGAQGIQGTAGATGATGPTGAASTVAGPTGPAGAAGPTGPAGTAPTGGASYYTGDIVISANTTQYTAPTWLPCDGAMYTVGTYPSLDTLYQTPGDYSTTPGWFTEPRDNSGNGLSWYSSIAQVAGSVLDPITGDLLTFNYNYPSGSRILYIQRASDGRFVYNPNNQLASQVQSDWGAVGSIAPNFAISPDGQLLMGFKYSGGYLVVIYRRNTQAVENSTGVRWVRQASSTATTNTTQYYGLKINNNGVIVYPYNSTSFFAWGKYDPVGNSITTLYSAQTFQAAAASVGFQGVDWHPTLSNYAAIATQTTTTYYSGMYYWNGSGFVAQSYANTAQSYSCAAINRAGSAAYFGRANAIDIYDLNPSTGNLTFNSTFTHGISTTYMISFSQSDAFMVVSGGTNILVYPRTSAGAITYSSTGNSPENYGSYGISLANWKFIFDPVYNTLVGFGINTTTSTYTVQNWKGTAKTIVPATVSPGNKLKYYIKTGS